MFHTSFLVMWCAMWLPLSWELCSKVSNHGRNSTRSEACYIDRKIQCMDTLHLSVQPGSFPSSLEQLDVSLGRTRCQRYLGLKGYIQKPLFNSMITLYQDCELSKTLFRQIIRNYNAHILNIYFLFPEDQ